VGGWGGGGGGDGCNMLIVAAKFQSRQATASFSKMILILEAC
jgi:hypothetical protein